MLFKNTPYLKQAGNIFTRDNEEPLVDIFIHVITMHCLFFSYESIIQANSSFKRTVFMDES